jgi:hypothetical protein
MAVISPYLSWGEVRPPSGVPFLPIGGWVGIVDKNRFLGKSGFAALVVFEFMLIRLSRRRWDDEGACF